MSQEHPNDPLHGITLKKILETLLETYSWKQLFFKVKINCFRNDPTINSSLKFLRRTEWARKEVENIYVKLVKSGYKNEPSTENIENAPWYKKKQKSNDDRPDWMEMF